METEVISLETDLLPFGVRRFLLSHGIVGEIVEVVALFVGLFVIGPYEGEYGLAGYLGSIYLAAWQGKWTALVLILAPLLTVGAWLAGLWLYRRDRAEAGSPAA